MVYTYSISPWYGLYAQESQEIVPFFTYPCSIGKTDTGDQINIVEVVETHIKRQATRHDYLPSLLDDGDKICTVIEVVHGEEKNILYWAD
jgi:hypothetical protein